MILVSDLNKSRGDDTVLEQVGFSFGLKGIHGILGPVGSGKSALAEILAGIDEEYSGSVRIGERILGTDPVAWKKKIGYLPKDSAMDPEMTVSEILEMIGLAKGISPEKRERQITEALRLTGLSSIHRRLVSKLSVGQLKKLGLAAALLGNPDVLLLDEPIRGIGAEEREEILGLIRMLGELKTVVLFAEDYDTVAMLCEDVVLLSMGQVLASGSLATLEERLSGKEENLSLREMYAALRTPVTREADEMDEMKEEKEEDA